MRYFLLICFLLAGLVSVAQDDDPYQLDRYPVGLIQQSQLQLAQYHLNKGEPDSVLSVLSNIDTLIPNGGYACFLKAVALDQKSRFGEAAKWYLRAGRRSVDLRLTSRIEAFRSYGAEGIPEAKTLLQSLLDDYPAHNDVYYYAGQYYGNREYYDTAQYYLEKAVLILPWNYENHLLLAQVYYLQDKLPQSALAYATAVTLQPQTETSLDALGTVVTIAEKWQSDAYLAYRDKAGAMKPVMERLLPRTIKNHKSAYDIPKELDELLLYEQLLPQLKRVKDVELDPTERMYVSAFKRLYDEDLMEVFILHLFAGVQHKRLTARLEVQAVEHERMLQVFFTDLISSGHLPSGALPGQTYDVKLHYDQQTELLNAAGNLNRRNDPTGDWWTFHENGYLKSYGQMSRLGFEDSTWRYLDRYGNLERTEHYANGKLEDTVRVYYPSGSLKSETPLTGGSPNGTERLYYLDGSLLAEIPFVSGEREGTNMEFYINGQLKSIMTYTDGKREGLYAQYFPNGQEERTVYYKNNLAEGPVRAFSMQGNLQYEGNFKNGLPTGIWTYYDDWGDMTKFVTFDFGIPHGISRQYDVFGRLKSEMNYKGGRLDGRVYEFDTTGAIRLDAMYERGRLLRYVVKDRQGNVLHEVADQDGTLPYENFDNWGRKKESGVYVNGDRQRTWRSYYENGQVESVTPYLDDEIHGEALKYTPDGRLLSRKQYDHGQLNGKQYTFEGEEMLSTIINFAHDTLRGWSNGYLEDGRLFERLYFNANGAPAITISYDREMQPDDILIASDTAKWQYYYEHGLRDSTNYESAGDTITVHYHAKPEQVKLQWAHRAGTKIGEEKSYHITGQLASRSPYQYGVVHGANTQYDAQGNWVHQTDYRYGAIDGISVSKYPNGQLRFRGAVQYGGWHGPMRFFDPEGRTTGSGTHYKDERHGPWTYYNDKGEAIGTLIYEYGKITRAICPFDTSQNLTLAKDGRRQQILFYYGNQKRAFEFNTHLNTAHGKVRRYAKSGQILEDGTAVYSKWHSTYKLYDPDGTLRLVERLEYGNKQGYERYYAPGGLLKVDAQYMDNSLHGKRRFYDNNGNRTRTEYYDRGRCYKVTEE